MENKVALFVMMSCIGSNSIIVLLLVDRKHNKIKYEQMFASQTNVYVQTHNSIENSNNNKENKTAKTFA